jgi:hypothetical protein
VAVPIQIRGYHRVRQRLRFLELDAGPEVALAVVAVNEAAETFRTRGYIGMAIAVQIGNPMARIDALAGPHGRPSPCRFRLKKTRL